MSLLSNRSTLGLVPSPAVVAMLISGFCVGLLGVGLLRGLLLLPCRDGVWNRVSSRSVQTQFTEPNSSRTI